MKLILNTCSDETRFQYFVAHPCMACHLHFTHTHTHKLMICLNSSSHMSALLNLTVSETLPNRWGKTAFKRHLNERALDSMYFKMAIEHLRVQVCVCVRGILTSATLSKFVQHFFEKSQKSRHCKSWALLITCWFDGISLAVELARKKAHFIVFHFDLISARLITAHLIYSVFT